MIESQPDISRQKLPNPLCRMTEDAGDEAAEIRLVVEAISSLLGDAALSEQPGELCVGRDIHENP